MSKAVHIERLAREYAERGYVVVEDYLARDVVDACRTECEDVMRARIGTSDDGRARWADLEALGCVAQVNAPSTIDARDSDLNHRARHSHGALCQWRVSEVIGRDGAIGKVAIALLGEDARLFNDQYVVKPPARSDVALRASCFEWHHDSQWCDDDGKAVYAPYMSAWVALDDVCEENGTLRFLPYPPSEDGRSHSERAKAYPARSALPSPLSDNIDDVQGKLLTVRAGSVVFFSDAVLHCSGPNVSETIRRAWMPQFSSGPIMREDGRAIGLTAKLV